MFEQGIKNSLQWRHLHDEGELMAGPQHQPTAKPLSSSCYYLPIQNKNQSRRRTFCVEAERKKMPDPEEDPPGPSTQKSAFKPVDSDQFQIGPRTSGRQLQKQGKKPNSRELPWLANGTRQEPNRPSGPADRGRPRGSENPERLNT